MTTSQSDDFAAWLAPQLHPEAAPAAAAPEPDAPSTPKPDHSQGGTGVTIPPSAAQTFAHLIHDHL